ncbi:DEAD/DEAH box helicase, partial [Mycobacterium tuberculosis]
MPGGETKGQGRAGGKGGGKKRRHRRGGEAGDEATAGPGAHDQAERPQHAKGRRDGGRGQAKSRGEGGY